MLIEEMQEKILKAIPLIQNKTHQAPSPEEIFNFLKSNERNIDVKAFKDAMWELENSNRIYIQGKRRSRIYRHTSSDTKNVNDLSCIPHYDMNQTLSTNKSSLTDSTVTNSDSSHKKQSVTKKSTKSTDDQNVNNFDLCIDGLAYDLHFDGKKSDENIHLMYEKIIFQLRSEIKLLKDLNQSKDSLIQQEILFLKSEFENLNNAVNNWVNS